MLGRVAQLVTKEFGEGDGFRVIYGLEDIEFQHGFRLDLNFGHVTFTDTRPEASKTYICGGYFDHDEGDGFKEIAIVNFEMPKDGKEDTLLVIIPFSSHLETTAKRIAGRYPHEAILEMHAGDIVEVDCGETYQVVEVGIELLLLRYRTTR